MSKENQAKAARKERKSSLRYVLRRDLNQKIIPISLGVAMAAAIIVWVLLIEADPAVPTITIACFVFVPIVVLAVCLITSYRIADALNVIYGELNDAVQRLVMGHYRRVKPHDSDDRMQSVYNGLHTVAGQIVEKDKRIESIGKKCDQLEIAREKETCRWLGTRVDPELINTIFCGVETMAKDGRCEDILEVLEDAKEVLSASLESGVALRPLADELSRIKRFLEIYEIVHGYKIGYRMSIMCNIVNYRIIPNLVLPVVQILFNRAREKSCEDYELGVEVNSSFTNLLIIVRDNNGLASEDDFNSMVNDDTTSKDAEDGAISIGALNRRVSTFYGQKYSIKLSRNKLGTAVYLYLPPVSSDNQAARK